MSISIGPALHPAHFISELKNRRRGSVLGELSRRAQAVGAAQEPELLQATLLLRERLGSTSVGHGVAVPNARSLLVLEPLVLIGRSRRGIAWSVVDREPVHLVLLVLSPPGSSAARPARARQKLLESERPEEIAAILREVVP
jgi:mannitol/fructose-specific phosphotransferase system IIA component (Ntr-type)